MCLNKTFIRPLQQYNTTLYSLKHRELSRLTERWQKFFVHRIIPCDDFNLVQI